MIDLAGKDRGGVYLWNAVCDCGIKKIVRQKDVLRGKVASCGCIKSEMVIKRNTTHGCAPRNSEWHHPLYRTWTGIMTRCFDKTSKAYQKYGAIGISCHEPWKDFPTFRDELIQEIGNKPSTDHTLDRIDNANGGYYPKNLRWATAREQSRNRKSCHMLTHENKTMSIMEWAEHLKMPYSALQTRIKMLGWTTERALTTPVMKNSRRVDVYDADTCQENSTACYGC